MAQISTDICVVLAKCILVTMLGATSRIQIRLVGTWQTVGWKAFELLWL